MEKEKSKFLKIMCNRCGKNHVVFGKACTNIKCDYCNKLLIKTKGGKTKIKTLIKEVF